MGRGCCAKPLYKMANPKDGESRVAQQCLEDDVITEHSQQSVVSVVGLFSLL